MTNINFPVFIKVTKTFAEEGVLKVYYVNTSNIIAIDDGQELSGYRRNGARLILSGEKEYLDIDQTVDEILNLIQNKLDQLV